MLGKRLIKSGADAAGGFVPSEHFETVTYTGNGGTQRIGGYINRGGVFNGSSSITLGGLTSFFTPKQTLTVSLWFKTSGSNLTRYLFSDEVFSFGSNYNITIAQAANGTLNVATAYGGVAISYNTTTTYNDNIWHNIVATINQSNSTGTVYVDGSLSGSYTLPSATKTGTPFPIIGTVGNYYNPFIGQIDQVRIFNKELSAGEVSTLYGETYASSTVSTTDIFSDNSGVALYQLDGNANDTGGVSGKFGEGGIFNGSSSIIDLPNNSFNLTTVSVSFWLKLNSITGEDYVLDVYDETGSVARGYAISTDSSNKIKFRAWDNANFAEVFSSTTLSLNTWYHIVIAGTQNSASVYINGSLDNSGSLNGFSFQSQQSTSIGAFRATTGSSSINFLDGTLDDVRIYSDVLTSTEVGYIYNNTTASIPTDNLVAYYKLDGDARDEQQLYDGTATNVSYAYNGTATNVTYQEATKFQPDLVWIKHRSGANNHQLYDSNRGGSFALTPNLTEPDYNAGAAGLTFNTNGFTINNGYSNHNGLNETYAAWTWKAGGAAVSNTDGSITSQVSVNQDAGFSIVKYNSATTSSTNFTIGHGLSSTPEMIITKVTSTGGDWYVWNKDLSNISTNYLRLNATNAEATLANMWGTGHTATTIGLRTSASASTNHSHIAYCFHSVEGFSKTGSYNGTGTGGHTIVTGFEPAMIIMKAYNTGSSWFILDNERNPINPKNSYFRAEVANAEANATAGINFLSNGFEFTGQDFNDSGVSWIYMAFAADPDTTTPVVENSFDVVTFDGTGTSDGDTQTIITDFKPDLVWVKSTDTTGSSHTLYDSVRGVSKFLQTNATNAENNGSTTDGGVTAFNDNGFNITRDTVTNLDNVSGRSYVAWCWKAGDHDDNLPQINTEGTIDSVVSVNAAAGFSIVKYNSATTPSTNFTIGHGLSSTPEMIITKVTSTGGDWYVWNKDLSNISTNYLRLNASDAETTLANMWGTGHTATTIGLRTSASASTNHSHIAYCFHSVSGYQKVGSYTGSTSAVSVTTGFQPRFVLVKGTTEASNWTLWDNIRGGSVFLQPNNSGTEASGRTLVFNSNGFTVNTDAGVNGNNNGQSYIYLAIK